MLLKVPSLALKGHTHFWWKTNSYFLPLLALLQFSHRRASLAGEPTCLAPPHLAAEAPVLEEMAAPSVSAVGTSVFPSFLKTNPTSNLEPPVPATTSFTKHAKVIYIKRKIQLLEDQARGS